MLSDILSAGQGQSVPLQEASSVASCRGMTYFAMDFCGQIDVGHFLFVWVFVFFFLFFGGNPTQFETKKPPLMVQCRTSLVIVSAYLRKNSKVETQSARC